VFADGVMRLCYVAGIPLQVKLLISMNKAILLVIALLAMRHSGAQNVGIGTTTPHASAALEVSSSTQGFLLPRLTKTEKNVLPSPATGLMIYQTGPDSTGFHYYNSTGWVWINPTVTSSGGGLPNSALVLSETANNTALSSAGFTYTGLLRLPGAVLEQTATYAANTWLGTNTLPAPPAASGHLSTFNDSVFYVWGGNGGTTNPGTGVYKYSPLNDRWTNMNVLGTAPASGSAGVRLVNKWVHWGGYSYPALAGPPAVVYDLAANTITNTTVAPTSVALGAVAATGAGTKAYFFGGYYLSNFSIFVNAGYVYDVVSNSWQAMTTTDAPQQRYYAGMVHTGTQIIVWGGWGTGGYLNTGGIYNIATDTWVGSIGTVNAPPGSIDPIMVWRSPYLYVISGTMAKRYDIATFTWTNLATAPTSFNGNKFAYDGVSKIYIWGGTRVFTSPLPTANGYIYDIDANTFTAMPAAGAPDARGDHTLSLGNNMLLVWGGTANNSSSPPTAAQSLATGGRFLLSPATATNAAPAPVWHLFKKQ
jgi:N-acetylneuraminic acid mutarotase